MTRSVRDIIRQHLEKEGCDGLFSEEGCCACLRDDLAPCGHMNETCQEGYRIDCVDPNCEFGPAPHWHIMAEKPAPKK